MLKELVNIVNKVSSQRKIEYVMVKCNYFAREIARF